MEFFTVSKVKRPVRLCESTRQFAFDSLNHVYGLDTVKTDCVSCDDIEGFESMTGLERYNAAIRKIAETAPIRICKDEIISGAATLGRAISHTVPAKYGDDYICSSVSHLTIDFESVLKRGVSGIHSDVEKSLRLYTEPQKAAFLQSCASVLNSFEFWHKRYLDALKALPEYQPNYQCLSWVPFNPARNFREAVQSIWFTFAFVRLCGNWPGIGRIDYLLGDYLKRDLTDGTLTLDEAREILAHFFIKGCEWIKGGNCGSGDAQHYQNIVLTGVDENGKEVTNEVTYLVLDIIEELGISDFPATIRLNSNTDECLLRRTAEVIKYGGGVIAVYNEDLVLDALTDYGYPLEGARKFANDGCWEVQIPGKTYFTYIPFDSLAILHHLTLKDYSTDVNYESFDLLYRRFASDLRNTVSRIASDRLNSFLHVGVPTKDWKWKPSMPCTVVSLFEQGCIEKGLSYLEGGPVYNVVSPHIGGLADTVNSLYAIKKIVFDEKKVTFPEFMKILYENWEGNESLRQYVLTHYTYYGNDNDEVDEIAVRIVDDFTAFCAEQENTCGYKFPAGVSTFGRQLEWAKSRLASAHGHRKGDVLAPNCSPTPGSDREGATAIIRSYCKLNLKKTVTGAALDVKLLPSSVNGEDGTEAIVSLMRGFVALGGFFMQPDVQDAEILRHAQEHPEDYQTLSVRVSGWNARFVTLCKEWQDMIIDENK